MNGVYGLFPSNYVEMRPASGGEPPDPTPNQISMEAPINELGLSPSTGMWSLG